MKFYDKEIYKFTEKLKTFILVLIVFIIGFLIGYFCKNEEYEEKVNRQAIEIIDLKEQIHRVNMKVKEIC